MQETRAPKRWFLNEISAFRMPSYWARLSLELLFSLYRNPQHQGKLPFTIISIPIVAMTNTVQYQIATRTIKIQPVMAVTTSVSPAVVPTSARDLMLTTEPDQKQAKE
jgi:hypothetical protein